MTIKIPKKMKPQNSSEEPKNIATKMPGIVIPFATKQSSDGTIDLTEDDIAEEFAVQYKDTFRFDHHLKKWFWWNGVRWLKDDTQLAFHQARLLCRKHRDGDTKMASRRAADGVEHMARSDKRLAVTSNVWDHDPFLLGTPSGTVDLKTGKLEEAHREDFITKNTAISPALKGTDYPIFRKFLEETTAGDKDLQRFLQQWAGYCLTGATSEQALLFIYGPGGNGKSVFQNTLSHIMGEYTTAATMETFAASKYQGHSTQIAMLHGARLVVASETEKGQGWSEAKINQLTGGDPISARFMRQDNFTFLPKFKLMIIGNHKPQLSTVNDAARRRINIVPFIHKPKEPDQTLAHQLQQEYPAILRWMIEGCLDWQANGLIRPAAVTDATAEYFDEQDMCGRWLDEKCDRGAGKKEGAQALYTSWKEFAQANGEDPGTAKTFAAMLAERGFKKIKSGSICYLGIKVQKFDIADLAADL